MEVKDLLAKEYALRHTKLQEGKFDDYDDYDDPEEADDYEIEARHKAGMGKSLGKKYPLKKDETPKKKAAASKKPVSKKKSVKEDFEENQPELYDNEDIAHVDAAALEELKKEVYDWGARAADKYANLILKEALQLLQKTYERANINMGAQADKAGYGNISDDIMESDDFMEITTELGREFLLGMENSWFNPIVSE